MAAESKEEPAPEKPGPAPEPSAAEPEKAPPEPEPISAPPPDTAPPPPAVEPAAPVSAAAATLIAIPAAPVPATPPEPAPAPQPVVPPPAIAPAAPPAPAPPTPPQPAEIPVAAKTLVFAPIAPPAPGQTAAAVPPPAEPAGAADWRTPSRPVPAETPTSQAGSMEVRPMRVTPVVGVAKVVTRNTGPLDLSTLTPPPGGGKRPTSDVIGAPRPVDPHDKGEPRAKPAHAEGVKVVVPEAPVMEVGQDSGAATAEGAKPAEPIRALRVRLTQELQVVKPPEPSRKKVVILAALGGMGVALLVWVLILMLT